MPCCRASSSSARAALERHRRAARVLEVRDDVEERRRAALQLGRERIRVDAVAVDGDADDVGARALQDQDAAVVGRGLDEHAAVAPRASSTPATNAKASSEPLAQTTRSAGAPWRAPIQARRPLWPPGRVRERDHRLPLHRARERGAHVVDGQHVGARNATRERNRIGHARQPRGAARAVSRWRPPARLERRPPAGAQPPPTWRRASNDASPGAAAAWIGAVPLHRQPEHPRAHVLRAERDRERVARLGVVARAQRERIVARGKVADADRRDAGARIPVGPARAVGGAALLHERALEVARVDARALVRDRDAQRAAVARDAQAAERRRRDVVDPEAQAEAPPRGARRVDRDRVVARPAPTSARPTGTGSSVSDGPTSIGSPDSPTMRFSSSPRMTNGRTPPPPSASTVTPALIARRSRWKR